MKMDEEKSLGDENSSVERQDSSGRSSDDSKIGETDMEIDNTKIDAFKKEIAELEDKSRLLVKEKEDMIASEEYSHFIGLKADAEKLNLKTNEMENKLHEEFSILKRPLKKYARHAEDYKDIIRQYITDVRAALIADTEFKIIRILEGISASIASGELCSEGKKAERVTQQIRKLDLHYFEDFVRDYGLLVEDRKLVEEKISGIDIKEKMAAIDRRQKSISSDIRNVEQELESEKKGHPKKTKKCPRCGKDIPTEWRYHKDCGWKKSEEDKDSSELIGNAKIDIFTSPTCPHCAAALDLVRQIAKERDDVKINELSTATPYGSRKARQMDVMAVPSIFVRGPAYPQNIGFRGVPSKKGLLKAIDISLGKAEWEEKKGLLQRLLEKITIKLKG